MSNKVSTPPPKPPLYVNKTQCDWIRIATWSDVDALEIRSRITSEFWSVGTPEPWRFQQYKGRRIGYIKWGAGKQAGRYHFIIEVSGAHAHCFLEWFLKLPESVRAGWYATRLDIQSTRLTPGWDNRPLAYKRLRDPKQLTQSSTGTTLYVGSRTSDSYYRIYDKTELLLRCELELKGKQANKSLAALQKGESLTSIYATFLRRSRVPKKYCDYFGDMTQNADLEEAEPAEDMERKLDWFAQLDKLAYKLANDHDTRDRFKEVIERWLEYVQDIDES